MPCAALKGAWNGSATRAHCPISWWTLLMDFALQLCLGLWRMRTPHLCLAGLFFAEAQVPSKGTPTGGFGGCPTQTGEVAQFPWAAEARRKASSSRAQLLRGVGRGIPTPLPRVECPPQKLFRQKKWTARRKNFFLETSPRAYSFKKQTRF